MFRSRKFLEPVPRNYISGLKTGKDAKWAVVQQPLITLDKTYFTLMVSMLPKPIIIKVNKSIKLIFDIE